MDSKGFISFKLKKFSICTIMEKYVGKCHLILIIIFIYYYRLKLFYFNKTNKNYKIYLKKENEIIKMKYR